MSMEGKCWGRLAKGEICEMWRDSGGLPVCGGASLTDGNARQLLAAASRDEIMPHLCFVLSAGSLLLFGSVV